MMETRVLSSSFEVLRLVDRNRLAKTDACPLFSRHYTVYYHTVHQKGLTIYDTRVPPVPTPILVFAPSLLLALIVIWTCRPSILIQLRYQAEEAFNGFVQY